MNPALPHPLRRATDIDTFEEPTRPEWLTLSLQRRGSELHVTDQPRLAAKIAAFIIAGALTGAVVALAFEIARGLLGH